MVKNFEKAHSPLFVTKIVSIQGNPAVYLPALLMKQLGWRIGDLLALSADGECIVISKCPHLV
ncbi:AbrB/MazE/SpoVT family DNA-binding domain-containing protein [Candidatus Micrarchaeota archaeon]|nr:AbrB/MazE/SpoVT family DNA-binding domain-containing protein [Candidatus Micrarchaeota archaeon]